MARDLVLGNGELLVAFDPRGRLAELTWPWPGLDDHLLGGDGRTGLRLHGACHWLDSPEFSREIAYEAGLPIGWITHRSDPLGLAVEERTTVDPRLPILVRRLRVTNLSRERRSIGLLFRLSPTLGGVHARQGVYWDPTLRGVVHHYRQYQLLLGGISDAGSPATFTAEHRSAEAGQRLDARLEAGLALAENPTSLGSVESALEFPLEIEAQGHGHVDLWLALAPTRADLADRVRHLDRDAVDRIFAAAADDAERRPEWRSRLTKLPRWLAEVAERSRLVLRAFIGRNGCIPAAVDHVTLDPGRESYAYVWMRDGALVADALDLCQEHESALSFFRFASRCLHRDGYFLQRYQVDGTEASGWHPRVRHGRTILPIQSDQGALVLWALARLVVRRGDRSPAESLESSLTRPIVQFLLDFQDPASGLPLPSFDLWEERFGVHLFTVAATVAGLAAATALLPESDPLATRAKTSADRMRTAMFERFRGQDRPGWARRIDTDSGELDWTADASVLGLWLLGVRPAEDDELPRTLAWLEAKLRGPLGGFARYEGDPYCRDPELPAKVAGNPWILVTTWVAQARVMASAPRAVDQVLEEARRFLTAAARPSGLLPEQVHPLTMAPESVCPLVWSHASVVALASAVSEVLEATQDPGDYPRDPAAAAG